MDEGNRTSRWTPKTVDEYEAVYELFLKMVGDMPISRLNHAVMREYKQTLPKLPPNINKSSQYRGKTLKQILRMRIEKALL